MQIATTMRLSPLFAKVVVWMVVALLVAVSNAFAGNQREEVLADAIKLALARSINDPRPPHLNFANDAERMEWQRWSGLVSKRLHSRMPDTMVRSEFLQTLWYEARRAGLEPALILGLIQVESGFR
jgi:soluble lytic murein transglycosylase-like protein